MAEVFEIPDIKGRAKVPPIPDRTRAMVDVTDQYERLKAQMLLIRVTLGLSPYHDVLTAVQVLHAEGREAFEKMRGPKSDDAASWVPR